MGLVMNTINRPCTGVLRPTHSRVQVAPQCPLTCLTAQRQPASRTRPVACQSSASPPSLSPEKAMDQKRAWEKAVAMLKSGEVFETTVKTVNKGGIVVDCWSINGFVPKSMLWPAAKAEEGQTIRVIFREVDQLSNRLILSQKQVFQAELLKSINVGDMVEGTISWIEPYGAFCSVDVTDAKHQISGLIRKSELSWKQVVRPESVVEVGQQVKCVVLEVDRNRGRVSLSLKQTQPDPLKQNVETMMPVDDESQWEAGTEPISGVSSVIRELQKEEGITEVKIGRVSTSQGVVSQDLELWLTKEAKEGHFNVVARGGSSAQELAVYCTLSRNEMKAAIDRVLTRI